MTRASGVRGTGTASAWRYINRVPRERFVLAPTPLAVDERLRRCLGLPCALAVKRDDLTGAGMGGNKVRKLEYLLADARLSGADVLVTAGAAQSNSARLVAILGRAAGFEVHLVLGTGADGLEGALVLDRLAGARIVSCATDDFGALEERLDAQCAHLLRQGRRPYRIPLGGSTTCGALGYVRGYLEILDDLDAAGIEAGWIVHASSTGGTQAGLLAGRALAGRGPRVFGVDVIKGGIGLRRRVRELGTAVLRRLGSSVEIGDDEIHLSDWTGPAYGAVTPQVRSTVLIALRGAGLVVDPVYSGKALAAITREPALHGEARVVFLHTGGLPVLFAERYARSLLTTGGDPRFGPIQ